MIDNFRDHAANERTNLACIRTSVALMGLFLIAYIARELFS
jgi:uncharacterized membrane protein YidH (DUF202 family)